MMAINRFHDPNPSPSCILSAQDLRLTSRLILFCCADKRLFDSSLDGDMRRSLSTNKFYNKVNWLCFYCGQDGVVLLLVSSSFIMLTVSLPFDVSVFLSSYFNTHAEKRTNATRFYTFYCLRKCILLSHIHNLGNFVSKLLRQIYLCVGTGC